MARPSTTGGRPVRGDPRLLRSRSPGHSNRARDRGRALPDRTEHSALRSASPLRGRGPATRVVRRITARRLDGGDRRDNAGRDRVATRSTGVCSVPIRSSRSPTPGRSAAASMRPPGARSVDRLLPAVQGHGRSAPLRGLHEAPAAAGTRRALACGAEDPMTDGVAVAASRPSIGSLSCFCTVTRSDCHSVARDRWRASRSASAFRLRSCLRVISRSTGANSASRTRRARFGSA
jgi:hypothetical protein